MNLNSFRYGKLTETEKKLLRLFDKPGIILNGNDRGMVAIFKENADSKEALEDLIDFGIIKKEATSTSHIDGLVEYSLSEKVGTEFLVNAIRDNEI